jgi:hypothetical protein
MSAAVAGALEAQIHPSLRSHEEEKALIRALSLCRAEVRRPTDDCAALCLAGL